MIARDLFDLPPSLPFGDFFLPGDPPWTWVDQIGVALDSGAWEPNAGRGERDLPAGVHLSGDVYLHPGVQLPPTCVIEGPAYLGEGTEVRPGAYLRGGVIAGAGCVLGHACEYKNCLLLDGVESAHFNYVGDSVLGNRAHLGAGVILANLKLDRGEVSARTPGGVIPTGRRKLGALVGDGVEVACNAVLQPGAILGRGSVVFSGVAFGGYLPPGHRALAVQRVEHLPPRR